MLELLSAIIHIVIVLLLVLGWVLFFATNKQKAKQVCFYVFNFVRKNWRELFWSIYYLFLVGIATNFVMCNIDKCLNMSFFNKFDGYNIVWIAWLILLLMPLISVDNKWFKIQNPMSRAQKEVEKEKESIAFEKKISAFKDLSSKESLEQGEKNDGIKS